MKPIRPPIPGDSSYYPQNNPSKKNLRPPLPNQDTETNNNNNPNNNIKNPFSNKNNPNFTNPNTPFQNQNKTYENESQENSENEDNYKEQKNTPKHKTSQKHKTPDSEYNINPQQIPRPNQSDEIYSNNEKLPFYETNIGSPPPHTTTFYSVKETQNSSCRFIRSTLNSVPISQS
jgi:hypothetical protein